MSNELMKRAAKILHDNLSSDDFTKLVEDLDGGENLYDYTVEIHAKEHPDLYVMNPFGELAEEKPSPVKE